MTTGMATDLTTTLARPIELVILDCDGVLVDSERVTNALLATMTTEAGWPMTTDACVRRFKGRELAAVQAEIEQQTGRSLGETFIAEYRRRMTHLFQTQGVPPIRGAAMLLDRLDAANVPHAVASNGPQEKMRLTLGRIGGGSCDRYDNWFDRFEGRRFSAYDLGVWKPDPGLFLEVAHHMNAKPEHCVVVEDSASGIRAAAAAGMMAIGFVDLSDAQTLEAAGANLLCGTMESIVEVVASEKTGRAGHNL